MNSKPPVNSLPHANNLESNGHKMYAAVDSSFCSALFPTLNPDQKENRRFLKEEKIFSIGSLAVVFTGAQFDQSDFDVYLGLLATTEPSPPISAVKFHAASFLQKLGKPTGKSDLEQFDSVLKRLCGGVIELTDHKKRYFGSLIEGGEMDGVTMNYKISMNKQFQMLFGPENISQSSNVVCNSLFAKLKGRNYFEDYVVVGEMCGLKIEFVGEQLDRDDYDTLLQLVNMASSTPFGDDAGCKVDDVLMGLGRINQPKQRRELFEQINRIVGCTFRLTTPEYCYRGHLLNDASISNDGQGLFYRLNPNLAQAYANFASILLQPASQ